MHKHNGAPTEMAEAPITYVVAGDGLEPPTRGFSILCSTRLSYPAALVPNNSTDQPF